MENTFKSTLEFIEKLYLKTIKLDHRTCKLTSLVEKLKLDLTQLSLTLSILIN